MRLFFLFLLLISLVNCKDCTANDEALKVSTSAVQHSAVAIDTLEVFKKELVLNQLEGVWYYKNEPYNGFSVKLYSNGTTEERMGFYNGKRQGITQRWSPKGSLQSEREYHQNKLVGTYKTWWENGELAQESHYVDGIQQGTEKQWHPNGQLAKLRKIENGTEQGMQQAWLKNGDLYVNYEAKNGRVFGLRRSNSCYKLEDETIIRTKK